MRLFELSLELLLEELLSKLDHVSPNNIQLSKEKFTEKVLSKELLPIAQKYNKNIRTQARTMRGHVETPDISIGADEILIELKVLTNLNDLYRLFYQVIKYQNITKFALIICIFDINHVLEDEDKRDLKSLEHPPKILKIIRRF